MLSPGVVTSGACYWEAQEAKSFWNTTLDRLHTVDRYEHEGEQLILFDGGGRTMTFKRVASPSR